MEYYIFLTNRCNIRCSYCSAGRVVSSGNGGVLSEDTMKGIIDYIARSSRYRNSEDRDLVVFFGGEPLLEYELIERFVEKAYPLDLSYALYTNGMLLRDVPVEVLNHMDVILVSFDGDRTSHERHRGRGTYDTIINNLHELKPSLSAHIIGRITVEEETDIYLSATSIINRYVDSVYWQIVNKPNFKNKGVFIKRYREGIKRLFDLWLERFRDGEVLRMIPFQAITGSLIFGYNRERSFRCGAGSEHRTIDVEGNVYWCDEYVGDERGMVGHIKDRDSLYPIYRTHREIFQDCRDCDVEDICLGRCRKALTEYSDRQRRIYCGLTRYLINTVAQHTDEIRGVVEERGYSFEDIYTVPYCTEEIP